MSREWSQLRLAMHLHACRARRGSDTEKSMRVRSRAEQRYTAYLLNKPKAGDQMEMTA